MIKTQICEFMIEINQNLPPPITPFEKYCMHTSQRDVKLGKVRVTIIVPKNHKIYIIYIFMRTQNCEFMIKISIYQSPNMNSSLFEKPSNKGNHAEPITTYQIPTHRRPNTKYPHTKCQLQTHRIPNTHTTNTTYPHTKYQIPTHQIPNNVTHTPDTKYQHTYYQIPTY